ncbi:Hypothetical predicted protein [Olea europaea subsp. europaea]|uniref:Uncharacterized protein n=1 Tax=Olea europaea subsp. europaea TaxID=158383 RepID=A0A8S0QD44_OLEEU|nr:Hypothetical predicted protein [Olea europaea subsp. europaea]
MEFLSWLIELSILAHIKRSEVDRSAKRMLQRIAMDGGAAIDLTGKTPQEGLVEGDISTREGSKYQFIGWFSCLSLHYTMQLALRILLTQLEF